MTGHDRNATMPLSCQGVLGRIGGMMDTLSCQLPGVMPRTPWHRRGHDRNLQKVRSGFNGGTSKGEVALGCPAPDHDKNALA